MYVIPVIEDHGGTNPLTIDNGRCDVCLTTNLCLVSDSAAGEYGDNKICKACIDQHFTMAATERRLK